MILDLCDGTPFSHTLVVLFSCRKLDGAMGTWSYPPTKKADANIHSHLPLLNGSASKM